MTLVRWWESLPWVPATFCVGFVILFVCIVVICWDKYRQPESYELRAIRRRNRRARKERKRLAAFIPNRDLDPAARTGMFTIPWGQRDKKGITK